MAFRTKLDFSDNRQVKQHIETLTILSGATNFGVPFNTLPVGPNLLTTGETENYSTVASTFSGNSASTIYSWYHPAMEYAISSLSALTPSNSGVTQEVVGFSGNSYTVIDGNSIALGYSGASYDLTPFVMYDLGGGNYSGTVYSSTLDILSASTLDFTGRTIWADVSGITRTEDLIIARNPVIGNVWTCIDAEGKGAWSPVSGGSSGSTNVWIPSIGSNSAILSGSTSAAYGQFSIAEGGNTIASGISSHAEGIFTQALGDYSHAEGGSTIASGNSSHAEGGATQANNFYAHAEGRNSIANGFASHAEGGYTTANGTHAHAEGRDTIANGDYSHTEGSGTTASGMASHAEGRSTIASVEYSHAEGYGSEANGYASHAEGYFTEASADAAHAEGDVTLASGFGSHAEGGSTIANGLYAHAEGSGCQAIGQGSHAQGNSTQAVGTFSHSGGRGAVASADTSFNHSYSSGFTSTVNSAYSAILGGTNNIIFTTGATNSVILGGTNITATTANTAYVHLLNIKSVGAGPGTVDIGVDATGNVVNQASDMRLKENINTIENALDKVMNLRGVTYNWRDRERGGDALKIGFIAQEVNNIIPELVFHNANDEFMGVHYKDVTALLVEAIKELVSGNTVITNTILETQTIVAEDNNIELNYNGTEETAIGGGIRVLRGNENASELTINEEGDWVTNNGFKPNSITIPTYTPTSSNDEFGKIGNITQDDDYLYVKTNNGWKRTNLESF